MIVYVYFLDFLLNTVPVENLLGLAWSGFLLSPAFVFKDSRGFLADFVDLNCTRLFPTLDLLPLNNKSNQGMNNYF